MENLDQSMIDDIIASADEDSPESRIDRLEEEITEIKGSIKKLLLDIRETINIIENPFQSIQSIAESVGSGKVQALQIIPPEYSEPEKNNEDGEKESELDEGKEENMLEDKLNVPEFTPEFNNQMYQSNYGVNKADKFQDQPLQELKKLVIPIKQIDPLALYSIIEWSNEMLGRYSKETLVELVEVFEMVGYISGEIKEVVVKIIELLDRDNNLDNAIVDLYKLYNILNPEDVSLDSKVLKLLLNNGR